jgi:hypothetical protein
MLIRQVKHGGISPIGKSGFMNDTDLELMNTSDIGRQFDDENVNQTAWNFDYDVYQVSAYTYLIKML